MQTTLGIEGLIATWVNNLRKKNRASEAQVTILNATEGWEWKVDSFMISAQKWAKMYEALNPPGSATTLLPLKRKIRIAGDKDEFSAACWAHSIKRNDYRITTAQKAYLRAMKGWVM